MCKWGTYKEVKLLNGSIKHIDFCIADLIQIMNNNGIETINSCCGHGKIPASILIKDFKTKQIFEINFNKR
jgi:hypothetical protein